MKTKKLLIIIILFLFSKNVFSHDRNKIKFHELRVSLGVLMGFEYVNPFAYYDHIEYHENHPNEWGDDWECGYNYNPHYIYSYDNINCGFPSWNNDTFYSGDKYTMPAINISYCYQLIKWLSISCTVSYYQSYQNRYNYYSDDLYSKLKWHRFLITPKVRIDWLRTRKVRLYSSIGVGYGLEIKREEYRNKRTKKRLRDDIVSVDLTNLGIAVGRKVFAFGEMGLSTEGFIKAGFGYRFKY